jgi:hypothetical protein
MQRVIYVDWQDAKRLIWGEPQSRNQMKHLGIEVPVWNQLKPRGCVRLNIFLRGNEGGQDAELALVKEKDDPLGPL